MSAMPTLECTADVVIEAIGADRPGNQANGKENEETTNPVLSNEQFLRLEIRMPDGFETQQSRDLCHLVLVVDNSGSMAGQSWIQVQESLHAIVGASISQPHIKLDLIVYNTKAHNIPLAESNYNETISNLKAGGTTNFVSAFMHIYSVVSEAGSEYKQTTVVILTDGQDTENNGKDINQLVPKLREGFLKHDKQATVHTVGFTQNHDFRFLKNVAENGGTCCGMFRYCEPGENKQALQQKLDELFDFILQRDERHVRIEIMQNNCQILGKNNFENSAVVCAKVTQPKGEAQPNATILTADAWIKLEEPNELPCMKIGVETSTKTEGVSQTVFVPCKVMHMERKLMETAEEKTEWRLRILERNIDDLMNKTASAIAEKGDVSQLQERVEKIQRRISHTKVFGNGISREERTRMFEIIKYIQTNLDQVQTMLTDYLRSGTDSISLLARAHDMRYQAVFKKGRRQRVMDKRAAQNMKHAADAQKHLTSLSVDTDEIKRLSQDALQFFFCVMSQNSVKDILLGNDTDDVIGFGLAVKRSEVVLDEPTLIRLQVISGTLVSRNAMLDALEYMINVSSHLKAHGGFSFDPNTLGVTTVGTSREPINAWLPLFVTKSHWERTKVILKPALGSFCTLDPLGYHYKQLDVLFMVLGSMICQLSQVNLGEHQLRLLFAVMRTCTACLTDFDKEKEVKELVKNFVDSPAGRTKDIIPNLSTLIGYIVALSVEARKDIFSEDVFKKQFWLAFISEWLRRAAGPVYHDVKTSIINGVLNALLNNQSTEKMKTNSHACEQRHISTVEIAKTTLECTEEPKPDKSDGNLQRCNYLKELIRLCENAETLQVNIEPYDPASEVEAPDIKLERSDEMDRSMEIWAEKTTGHQKNLDKKKEYKLAQREVQMWLTESCPGKDELDSHMSSEKRQNMLDDTEECVASTDSSQVNAEVTDETLRVIAYLQHRLVRDAYPWLASLPSVVCFVNTWLQNGHDITEMDDNSGIAPELWVNEIKTSLHQLFEILEGKRLVEVTPDKPVAVTEKGESELQVVYNEESAVMKDDDFKGNNVDSDEEDPVNGSYYNDDNDVVDQRSDLTAHKEKVVTVTLPQILVFIDGNIDVVEVLRAMLIQAVRFYSNSSARAGWTNKQLLDLKDEDAAKLVAKMNHTYLQEQKVNAQKSVLDRAFWKRANHCMINATTPWAFVGYLMNTHSSRLEGFSDLVDLFLTTVGSEQKIPYLAEKIHILLTGQYKKHAVLDNGNQWLPEKKMASNFRKLLGDEVWSEFEMELRSSVQIHVYRESDIPNRHSHCNSNPYIPNVLRAKLGMALMPEKANVRKTRKGGSKR